MALNKVVGIDFGSSSLRAVEVELEKDGSVKHVERVGQVRIPTQVITNGSVVSEASLVSALKDLLTKFDIKTKDVVLSINGESIVARQVPHVEAEKDEKVFLRTLPYKLKDSNVPLEFDENYLGFHTVDEFQDEEDDKFYRNILLVAIQKKNLDSILRAVHQLGLRPRIVDIAPLGIMRANISASEVDFRKINEELYARKLALHNGTDNDKKKGRKKKTKGEPELAPQDATTQSSDVDDTLPEGAVVHALPDVDVENISAERTVCVDVGADVTCIIIHNYGEPDYVRIIPGVGGNIVTNRISDELHISLEDAETEKYKALTKANAISQRSTSIFEETQTEGIKQGTVEARHAYAVNLIVAEEVTILVDHIRDTLNDALFFHRSGDAQPIERIVLTGGGSSINTLASRLNAELEIPVEYGDPFEGLYGKALSKQMESNQFNPHEFAVALGSVIREEW